MTIFADARIRKIVSNDLHTTDKVLSELRKACDDAGSQLAWAEANGLSPSFVSDVLKERRDPSDRLSEALGFERVTMYRKRKAK